MLVGPRLAYISRDGVLIISGSPKRVVLAELLCAVGESRRTKLLGESVDRSLAHFLIMLAMDGDCDCDIREGSCDIRGEVPKEILLLTLFSDFRGEKALSCDGRLSWDSRCGRLSCDTVT